MDLVPLKATFAPREGVAIEVLDAGPGTARVFHLHECVAEIPVERGQRQLELPSLPVGGYGVELAADGGATVRTAFDVLDDPLARPRYGFAARFEEARDVDAVVENVRRLHLNALQFYDWMYRHARLVPPSDAYDDPLGRRLSLDTVRGLAAGLRGAGCAALGYAAVYAVGMEEWPEWEDAALLRPGGRPWSLGEDFLRIVDPSDERWLDHFTKELEAATTACGFAGFHLDQYGDPKLARRADGSIVDLGDAFPVLIDRVRAALPDARLIFNNVNNFPTWTTARARQDATYIEVWAPHTTLAHLARLIRDARAAAPGRPVILAAYLSVFSTAPEEEALSAARLAMATIFSHGGFHLLAGEEGAVLTDPYYVSHHVVGAETSVALRAWYDFAVRYGDLLYDESATEITTAVSGGINEDVVVEANAPVSVDPVPGSIWLRVVETRRGTLVHLIDLTEEDDISWDAPKRTGSPLAGTKLRLRLGGTARTVWLASPETTPALQRVEPRVDDDHAEYELPPFADWAMVLVNDAAAERD